MTMRPTVRNAAPVLAAAFACALPLVAAAQGNYPNRPIRVIVPFGTGSVTDVIARVTMPPLAEALGQTIIVDNRPGGGGNPGTDLGVKAVPDGYTLILSSASTLAVNGFLFSNMPYDMATAFSPITQINSVTNVLVVSPSLPVKSVPELIAHAKANPGKLNMSNAGSGFQSHLAGVLFTHMTGINVQHVPYKGGASLVAVIGNEAQVTIAPMPAVIGHVRAGKLRAIATGGEKRSGATPTLPTIIEAGVPGYVSTGWMGLMLPAGPSRAGPPKPLYERLRTAVVKVVDDPVTREQMERQGGEAMSSTPEAFLQLIREEYKRFQIAIGLAGLKVD